MYAQELGSKETVVISDEERKAIAALDTERTGSRWKQLSGKRNLYNSLKKFVVDAI